MNFDKSRGLALLPRDRPDERMLGNFVDDVALARELSVLPEPQQLAILWTAAIQVVLSNELSLAPVVPGFQFATIGFADPETEVDAFGVLAYTADLHLRGNGFRVRIGEHEFPVTVRPGFVQPHAFPELHPLRGTSACWARSHNPQYQRRAAFLTATHVVAGHSVGGVVETTHGPGELLAVAPESIDAALIASPLLVPEKADEPLECQKYVAQWTEVHFTGRGSRRRIDTKVSDVWFRDTYHPLFPARVMLGWPGEPGDSGSLVLDNEGKGIGLYLAGFVNTATRRMEGVCQHLGQAADLLDCELWQ